VKRLVEFPLEGGGAVVVEADEPSSGSVRAARLGEIAERAEQTFEAALETIKPAANAIITKLCELTQRPDEVSVEFGVKLNVKAGVVISADAEANYKVTLKWKEGIGRPRVQ
jgi:Trypsin-co-occurring domain 1